MRRSLALFLSSLMLVFALTACGGSDQPSNGAGDNDNAGTENGTGTTGGSGEDANAGGITGGENGTNGTNGSNGSNDTNGTNGSIQDDMGQIGDDIRDDMQQAGDNIQNGMDDLTGGNPSGISANGQPRLGASFSQMVRNARVHDKDGDLTDHENAVTPGSDRF